MKIIVIGASGTIGRAVSEELSQRHDVIRVGRTREIIRWISPRRRASRRCLPKRAK
jgi:nucleoside-diphosphate-sugar epimerase